MKTMIFLMVNERVKWLINSILLIIFLGVSTSAIADKILNAGESLIYPAVVSITWLQVKPKEPFNGYYEGTARVVWELRYGTVKNYARDMQQVNNTGARQYLCVYTLANTSCGIEFTTVSGITCTRSDGTSFQSCLKRYVGQQFSTIANFVNYKDEWTCLDVGLLPLSGTTSGASSDTEGGKVNEFVCGQSGTVVPPVEKVSVCSLNSQNLNLSYSSASLDVNGLSNSTSLVITCTTGDAKNYTLKLTGSNVSNGRLNFGNGVSAQVSLNGTQVAANGTGISLNGLTSQTLPVSASLVGSASAPGVTNASGVLVLEAL